MTVSPLSSLLPHHHNHTRHTKTAANLGHTTSIRCAMLDQTRLVYGTKLTPECSLSSLAGGVRKTFLVTNPTITTTMTMQMGRKTARRMSSLLLEVEEERERAVGEGVGR